MSPVAQCPRCHVKIHLEDLDEDELRQTLPPERAGDVVRNVVSMLAKWQRLIWCEPCYGEEVAAEERLAKATATARRIAQTGIPEELRGLTWDDIWQTSQKRCIAILAAQRWAESERPGGLYLWGKAGVGKTMIAAAALTARAREWDRPATWVSVAHLLARLDAAFTDDDRRAALSVLSGQGTLVLDDLDKTTASEHRRSQLFTAIDQRITAGAALIVTCNLPPAQLEAKFGEAISSRVLVYARGAVCELDGDDNRLRIGI